MSNAAPARVKLTAALKLALPGCDLNDESASRNRSWSMPRFQPVRYSHRVNSPIAATIALPPSAIVAAIGVLTLCEYLTGWNLGIDQLLFLDADSSFRSHPGRASFNAAVSFTLAGAALLMLETRTAQWLAAAAALPALVSTVGYVYEAEGFEGPLRSISMAPHTIAGIFALSAGLLCARPARGAMVWLASSGPQGLLLRQLLPSGIAILLATAFIAKLGHTGGMYGAAQRAALELSTAIVLLSALVLWAAAVLARVE